MIKELPCGCVPIQINKREAKQRLLAGELVWFDDNESYGFMKYRNKKVFSIVFFDDTHGEGVFDLKRANEILDEYEEEGHDFSYSSSCDIEVDVETGILSIVCNEE